MRFPRYGEVRTPASTSFSLVSLRLLDSFQDVVLKISITCTVVYHHGSSAAGGHYTLDVLHPNRNADANAKAREGWIRIDDELVTDLRGEDVFGSDRDCAYLLFYRRIGGSYARAGQMQ